MCSLNMSASFFNGSGEVDGSYEEVEEGGGEEEWENGKEGAGDGEGDERGGEEAVDEEEEGQGASSDDSDW